jgi:hypothetical protein
MFSNFNSSSFENSYFEETSQVRSFDFKMEIQDEIYDFKMNSLKEFSLQRVQFEETNMQQQQKKRTAFGDITRSWKN